MHFTIGGGFECVYGTCDRLTVTLRAMVPASAASRICACLSLHTTARTFSVMPLPESFRDAAHLQPLRHLRALVLRDIEVPNQTGSNGLVSSPNVDHYSICGVIIAEQYRPRLVRLRGNPHDQVAAERLCEPLHGADDWDAPAEFKPSHDALRRPCGRATSSCDRRTRVRQQSTRGQCELVGQIVVVNVGLASKI